MACNEGYNITKEISISVVYSVIKQNTAISGSCKSLDQSNKSQTKIIRWQSITLS